MWDDMGILSLIFAIVGIGIGVASGIYALIWTTYFTSDFFIYVSIAVIAAAIGAGLALKYYNDQLWSWKFLLTILGDMDYEAAVYS